MAENPLAYYKLRRDQAKRKISRLVKEAEGWNRLAEQEQERIDEARQVSQHAREQARGVEAARDQVRQEPKAGTLAGACQGD